MADPFSKYVDKYLKEKMKQRRYEDQGMLRNSAKMLGFGLNENDKYAREIMKKRKARGELEETEGGGLRIRRPGSLGTIITLFLIAMLGIGFYLFITGNALVNSALTGVFDQIRPSLNAQLGGVPLTDMPKYLGCVWDNSFVSKLGTLALNPGAVSQDSAGADLFSYCRQELVAAQDIGCDDCFTLTANSENFKVQAGTAQTANVVAIVAATEDEYCYNDIFGKNSCQPILPAENANVRITDQRQVDADIESGIDIGGELDPGILKSNHLTVVGTFDASSLCGETTQSIDPTAVLSYSYATQGQAPINVRKQFSKESFSSVNSPITLPGPLKIDIIPDSSATGGVYTSGIYQNAIVFIKFRNAGTGEARVTQFSISQIPPEGVAPLPIKSCSGAIDPSTVEMDGNGGASMAISRDGFDLSPAQRSNTITCVFDLSGAGSLPSDLSTFIITGIAKYDYGLKTHASSIIIDHSQDSETCPDKIAQGSGPGGFLGTDSGSGFVSGSGSSIKGSGMICTTPADENKVCPSGLTFQEDGCCR